MSKVKWLVLGYFIAFATQGCDSIMGSGDGSSSLNLEYGDYGTVPHKPLYVIIVE